MGDVVSFFTSSPAMQAIFTGVIVFGSALLVAGVSALLPFTVPLWIKALSTGIVAGVVIFFLSGGASGNNPDEKGQETIPEVIGEEININATEIDLNHKIDEENNTFTFILGGQEINMDNWKEDLAQKLEQYTNLKTIVVTYSGEIPYHLYVELKELDENYEDIYIEFKDLE